MYVIAKPKNTYSKLQLAWLTQDDRATFQIEDLFYRVDMIERFESMHQVFKEYNLQAERTIDSDYFTYTLCSRRD